MDTSGTIAINAISVDIKVRGKFLQEWLLLQILLLFLLIFDVGVVLHKIGRRPTWFICM